MKITKKLNVILVLSIFLIGMVPSVFAQDKAAENAPPVVGSVKTAPGVVVKKGSEAPLKTRLNVNARDMHNKGRDHYRAVLSEDESARTDLVNSLREVKKRGQVTRTDGANVQKRLVKFLENTINKLERMKQHVDNTCMDNDKGLAYIERVQAEAKSLLNEVNSWNPHGTENHKQELRVLLKKVKDFHHKYIGVFHHAVARSGSCKARHLYEQHTKLIERLQEIIDKAKAEGRDTSEAERILTEIRANHATSKERYNNLQDAWRDVDTREEAEELKGKTKETLRDLGDGGRTSYARARTAIQSLREM
jgi:hypothetical protein